MWLCNNVLVRGIEAYCDVVQGVTHNHFFSSFDCFVYRVRTPYSCHTNTYADAYTHINAEPYNHTSFH